MCDIVEPGPYSAIISEAAALLPGWLPGRALVCRVREDCWRRWVGVARPGVVRLPLPRSWTLDDVGVVLVRQPQSAPHAWGDPFRQRRRNPTEARYEQGQQVQRIPTLVSGGNRDVWQRGGGGRTNRPLCSGLVRCIASAAGSTTSGVDGAGHRRAASGTIGPTRPLNSSAPREVWGAPAAHATIPALTAAVIEDRIDRACSHTHGESHHPPISIPVPLHLHV